MTQETGDARILVGVDGSKTSDQAVDWAAEEARQRGATLRVVHVFPADSRGAIRDRSVWAAGQRLVSAAADRARQRLGSTAVVAELLEGPPAEALVTESQRSSLVVVGSRGHGGFAALLLGSTSVDLASHAACPVAVIRGPGSETTAPVGTADSPMVVGVDDSPGAERALEYTFARASERAAPVVAVAAWQLPTSFSAYAASELLRTDSGELERKVQDRLDRVLAPLQERYPAVDVERRAVSAHPITALVDASGEDAQCVVVGSRGRGNLKGMLLGSISQGVLRHAQSPVIVVR